MPTKNRSDATVPDTIVLIHGLWVTPRSWELWEKRYTDRGYKVINESWPGLEREVEALRRDPKPIAKLSVPEVLDHYERIIRALARPPIIIGHSFGGAFTQVLVSRGLGAAAVAVHPAPVRGILGLPLTTLRAIWPLLRNPIFRRRAVEMTAKAFRSTFTNTFMEEAAVAAYERYAIAGSRNLVLTGAYANLNPFTPLRVDFRKEDRPPLLFIGGGKDHVLPASLARHNAGKYRRSRAITDFVEFPDRGHFTAAQDGWEEVADYALRWALNPATESSAAGATPVQHISPATSPA